MSGKFVPFEQGSDPDWSHLYQVLAAANGYQKWGKVWSLTSLNDDINFELTVRNLGTSGGGRHIQALHSATGLPVVQITDAGLSLAGGVTPYPIGHMIHHAANVIPVGWLLANGQAVSRTTYALLFAQVGTLWGAGDGSTTFNVPDARGRFFLSAGSGVAAIGDVGGAATVDSSHAHTMQGHSHQVGAHGHDLYAHDHESGSYNADGTTEVQDAGEDRDIQDTGSGYIVAGKLHVHEMHDIPVNGVSSTGKVNSGDGLNDTAFESTKNKAAFNTSGPSDADTSTAGSTTLSIVPPFITFNALIYAGV